MRLELGTGIAALGLVGAAIVPSAIHNDDPIGDAMRHSWVSHTSTERAEACEVASQVGHGGVSARAVVRGAFADPGIPVDRGWAFVWEACR